MNSDLMHSGYGTKIQKLIINSTVEEGSNHKLYCKFCVCPMHSAC